MSFRKRPAGGDSAINSLMRAFFFFLFVPLLRRRLWTESGRIGMLHRRGNCVGGNWQLVKSDCDGDSGGVGGAHARDSTRTRIGKIGAPIRVREGVRIKFELTVVRNSASLSLGHLPRLRPAYRWIASADRGDRTRAVRGRKRDREKDFFKGPDVFTAPRSRASRGLSLSTARSRPPSVL